LKKSASLAMLFLLCSACQEHSLKREAEEWIKASYPWAHSQVTRFDDLRVVLDENRVCGRAFSRGDGVMEDAGHEREWLFIYQRGRMPQMMEVSETARSSPRFRTRWQNCADE
jgi:hypothetical protein